MKTLITTILLLLSTSAFADDKIKCWLPNGSVIHESSISHLGYNNGYVNFTDIGTGKKVIMINAVCKIIED